MLYRSAYAERVKQFCKENNHQVVSQVTGASWPLEPDEIRKKYEKLALLERDNHQAAHPDYKFAPNKTGKKRGRDEDDSDSDGEWSGKRSRTAASSRRDETRSNTAMSFEGEQWGYGSPGPYSQYGYQNTSYGYQYPPERSVPMYADQRPMGGHYWQTHVRPYATPGQVEDVHFSKVDNGFPVAGDMMNMVGLPNADGQHLLVETDPGMYESGDAILDPRLGEADANYPVQSIEGGARGPYGQQEPYHPGHATLVDARGWEERPGSDFDREFQHFST